MNKTIEDMTINGCTPLNRGELEQSARTARGEHLFQPGQSGNPKGRPQGTKDKITKLFIDDITHEWRNRGIQALSDLSSQELVRVCTTILPKDVLVSMGDVDAVRWVINASPRLSVSDWQAQHKLSVASLDEEDVG